MNRSLHLNHWRVNRIAKTDLREHYFDDNVTKHHRNNNRLLTLCYKAIILAILENPKAMKAKINHWYNKGLPVLTIMGNDYKYAKYHAISWVIIHLLCCYGDVGVPIPVMNRMVKRFNHLIDDKKRKCYVLPCKANINAKA